MEYVQAEGVTGECAFITAEMDGAAYDKAEGQIGAVLQSIRVSKNHYCVNGQTQR